MSIFSLPASLACLHCNTLFLPLFAALTLFSFIPMHAHASHSYYCELFLENPGVLPPFPDRFTPDEIATLEKARAFAIMAHNSIGQRREYTDEPYHHHVQRVANAVIDAGADVQTAAASFLHDTVEDIDWVTLDLLTHLFGEETANLVSELTKPSKKSNGTHDEKENIDLQYLKNASARAQTIKEADIFDNTNQIAQLAPEKAKTYLPEKLKQLEILQLGDRVLWQKAYTAVTEGFKSLAPTLTPPEMRRRKGWAKKGPWLRF